MPCVNNLFSRRQKWGSGKTNRVSKVPWLFNGWFRSGTPWASMIKTSHHPLEYWASCRVLLRERIAVKFPTLRPQAALPPGLWFLWVIRIRHLSLQVSVGNRNAQGCVCACVMVSDVLVAHKTCCKCVWNRKCSVLPSRSSWWELESLLGTTYFW